MAAYFGDEIGLAVPVGLFVMGEARDEDTAAAAPQMQREGEGDRDAL